MNKPFVGMVLLAYMVGCGEAMRELDAAPDADNHPRAIDAAQDVAAEEIAVVDATDAAPPRADILRVPPQIRMPHMQVPDAGTDAFDDITLPPALLPTNAPTSFVSVSARSGHGCAMRANGGLFCWGANWYGQSQPPEVAFAYVATGRGWSCGVRADSQQVLCWAIFAQHLVPAGAFVELTVGGAENKTFACGLTPDGTVQCWGDLDAEVPVGQFDHISAGRNNVCGIRKGDAALICSWQAFDMPAGAFNKVSLGDQHACGVKTDTSVVCWGHSGEGANKAHVGRGFSDVSAGGDHTCAIRNGGILCWGSNSEGQSDPPEGEFVQVSAGPHHTCAIRTDGELLCWGRIKFPVDRYTRISAGNGEGVCGIKPDETLSCWGEGPGLVPKGQFKEISTTSGGPDCGIRSDGTLTCWSQRGVPISEPAFSGSYEKLTTFARVGCAIRSDGSLQCWSPNQQLVNTPPGRFIDVSVSDFINQNDMACAVRHDGAISCWGDYDFSRERLTTEAPQEARFTQVSVSAGRACAVTKNGEVVCWPGISPPGEPMLQVAGSGTSHFCGLSKSNNAVCWSAHASRPRSPLPASHVQLKQISGSRGDVTCGVDTESQLWCWGDLVLNPLQ